MGRCRSLTRIAPSCDILSCRAGRGPEGTGVFVVRKESRAADGPGDGAQESACPEAASEQEGSFSIPGVLPAPGPPWAVAARQHQAVSIQTGECFGAHMPGRHVWACRWHQRAFLPCSALGHAPIPNCRHAIRSWSLSCAQQDRIEMWRLLGLLIPQRPAPSTPRNI